MNNFEFRRPIPSSPFPMFDMGRHYHGFNIPLFWLKSAKSCGIGDFSDLKAVVDWCALIKWHVIQLLPLCDTWDEASPYSPISAASLNWAYIDVSDMLAEDDRSKARVLNASSRVLYHQVRAFKRAVIERKCQEGHFWSQARNFSEQHSWVEPYARFCSLKEIFSSTAWWNWPPIDEQSSSFQRRRCFFITAQYLANEQMKSIKDYALSKSILIKGDLPILMSRDSCDVWRHPNWFDITQEVGSPPDVYSPDGQNWGFPPYRWEEIQRSDYSWWRERLSIADLYFHLYRLDHIAGFFRLWSIPRGKSAKTGSYLPQNLDEAEQLGRKNLRAILAVSRARMVGEDLGVIPPMVRQVMSELDIPGTKVMRWEKNWQQGGLFTPIAQYPQCSMTTVSTHDSQTLSQWWAKCPEESSQFASAQNWRWLPDISKEQRLEILRQSHRSNSFLHINLLTEYLSLCPDLAPSLADQRINIPGTISQLNWTCRSPIDFDQIACHAELINLMQALVFERD